MRRWWALLGVVGCGLPEPTLFGKHVEVAMDPGLEPCGDVVGHLDEYVAWLSAEWHVPPPGGETVIPYYWLDNVDFVERTPCVQNRGACAPFGNVYSTRMPHDHEVVHAAAQRFGLPPPFFIEGLAVAYEFPTQWQRGWSADTVRQGIDDFVGLWLPDSMYPVAGSFVKFIIERHGVEKFLIVYARLGFLDGRARISRVFEDVLGESLEDVLAVYEQAGLFGGCVTGEHRVVPFECGAPAMAWDGQRLAAYFVGGCDAEGAIGQFDEDIALLQRTFEVPEEGTFAVRVFEDRDVSSNRALVRLLSCEACAPPTQVASAAAVETWRLPAGKYALGVLGSASTASGVGLEIERLEEVGPIESVVPVEP